MLIRQCEQCGQEFKTFPCFVQNGGGRFCSKSCATSNYWDRHRSEKVYQRQRLPDHPLADIRGFVEVHRVVLYEKIGPGPHSCHWCGTALTWRSYKDRKQAGVLVVDHIDGTRHNNEPSNLVPSCFNCNKNRGKQHRKPQANAVRDDEPFLVDKHGWRHRAAKLVCETCGTEFLRMTTHLRQPGAGRFCSPACFGVSTRKAS